MSEPQNVTQNEQFQQGATAILVVHEQLKNIGALLAKVEVTLSAQGEQLGKLAVIEERNLNLQLSINRAFAEIIEVKSDLVARGQARDAADAALRKDFEEHKAKTKSWSYFVNGVVATAMLFWTLCGFLFVDTARTMVEMTQAYKYRQPPAAAQPPVEAPRNFLLPPVK